MKSTTSSTRAGLWAGRVLSALVILLLTLDSLGKLLLLAPVVEGSAQLGYSADAVFGLGVVLLACVLAYSIPATRLLGAVLLTGYLGGAVATHLRVGDPWLSHTLVPVYVGVLVWGGLFLRDPGTRVLVRWRQSEVHS